MLFRSKLTAWNPTRYLFETDVIVYFYTDIEKINYSLEDWGYTEIVSPFILLAGKRLDFAICYKFAIGITEAEYIITTTVKPTS